MLFESMQCQKTHIVICFVFICISLFLRDACFSRGFENLLRKRLRRNGIDGVRYYFSEQKLRKRIRQNVVTLR